MSDARRRVLDNVRRALHRGGPLTPSVVAGLEARLERRPENVRPALDGDPVARFVAKVEAVAGTAEPVPDGTAVSAAVVAYLDRHDLPRELVMGQGPLLASVPWSNELSIARRAATGDDVVSVTGAFAGVAETGTVVLLSAPESPTTQNFLPDAHLVVLERSRIVPHFEDAWRLLREERQELPRAVNLVTGPSRTADVELTLQLGAHGPRQLHVILVG